MATGLYRPVDGDKGMELLEGPGGAGGDPPGVKKSESSEVLNLTLHQVRNSNMITLK